MVREMPDRLQKGLQFIAWRGCIFRYVSGRTAISIKRIPFTKTPVYLYMASAAL
jgi:hypothetical protein